MESLKNLEILWHLNTPNVALALPSLRVQGALLQGVRMLRLVFSDHRYWDGIKKKYSRYLNSVYIHFHVWDENWK